jgi:hypothetical protein
MASPGTRPAGQPVASAALDAQDRAILAGVPAALAQGLRVMRWWQETDRTGSYEERFPLVRTFDPADSAFGYFGNVPLPAAPPLPVMGVYQEMFFDRPKGAEVGFFRDQLREFVLRYFLRVSSSRQPEAYVPGDRTEAEAPLPLLSWCPREADTRAGFGYQQLYYKLAGSGEIGKFPAEMAAEIVDLRDLGPVFDWIVARVHIFDFDLDFAPFGPGYPLVRLPLQGETLVVLSPEFLRAEDDPSPGVAGRFGLGYALLPSPAAGMLAFGPGQFAAGFQTIEWRILADGTIRACLAFAVNRPERIVNLSLNPAAWGFEVADVLSLGLASRLFAPVRQAFTLPPLAPDPIFTFIAMANVLSAGRAAQDLCISRQRLEMDMLTQHFMEHYELISGALPTWRRVPDWLDPALIPEWVARGRCG